MESVLTVKQSEELHCLAVNCGPCDGIALCVQLVVRHSCLKCLACVGLCECQCQIYGELVLSVLLGGLEVLCDLDLGNIVHDPQ